MAEIAHAGRGNGGLVHAQADHFVPLCGQRRRQVFELAREILVDE